MLADDWGSLDSVGQTANNYLAITAKMGGKVITSLMTSMKDVMPIGLLMRICLGAMMMVMAYHIVTALLRGIQDGSPRGFVGEVLDAVWGHGPRIFVFTLFSISACGISTVWDGGPYGVNKTNAYVKTMVGLAGTFQKVLGNETGTRSGSVNPVGTLREGTAAAIRGIDRMNFLEMKNVVERKIYDMVELGSKDIQPTGGTNTAFFDEHKKLDKLVKTILVPFLDFGVMMSFLASQYVLAKNLVANWIFLTIAWRMALHFLPLLIVLAYFRSLQGFLINGIKQIIAVSLAATVMAAVAEKLFSPDFWVGKVMPAPSVAGAPAFFNTADSDSLIVKALKDRKITTDIMLNGGPVSTPGSYPWIKANFAMEMILIQIGALYALIGVILGEIFTLVRAALDGAMRSAYANNIMSTTGR